MRHKYMYLLTAFLLSHHFLISQAQFESLVDGFVQYNHDHQVEKVHVSTNREVLSLGDTLWLSSWTVLRHNQYPTDLSKLLYVELIDPLDELVSRITLAIDDLGRSAGHFVLSDSADAGQYHLRAYTRYQENFSSDYFFEKALQVLPRLSNQAILEQLPKPGPSVNVDLLPEGGHLVAGKLNYLAFKVTDQSGFPLDIQGQIVVDSEQKLMDIETQHDGMGVIQIEPQSGVNYSLEFSLGDSVLRYPFPKVADRGYLLHFWQNQQKVFFSADAKDVSSPPSFALIHHHGKLLSILQKKEEDQMLYSSIARELLPSGVIVITLFNTNNEAVAERIFFNHNPTDYKQVSIDVNQKTISTREKVSVFLGQQEAGLASMSVRVVPSKLYKQPQESISSTLLLSTELRGKIQNPSYYTDAPFGERMEQIDLLMLTHGWRRYKWEEILRSRWDSLQIAPEKGLTLEGKVTSMVDRRKPLELDLYLSYFEDPLQQIATSSDAQGRFVFRDLIVEDSTDVFIKTMSNKERRREKDKSKLNSQLTITAPSFPELFLSPSRVVKEPSIDTAASERGMKLFDIEAAFSDDVVILDEFVIEEDKDPFQDPIEREFKLYGRPDERLVMDDLPQNFQFGTIFDMLRAQMPGVIITGTPPNQRITFQGRIGGGTANLAEDWEEVFEGGSSSSGGPASAGPIEELREPPSLSIGNGGPLVLLDGVVTEVVTLNSILPFEVEFIDVIKGPRAVVYGSRASQGIIAVYTKKGSDRVNTSDQTSGFIKVKLPGVFPEKEFYSPNFAYMSDDERVKPDYRNTIYWNPKLVMNGQNTDFSFYTSDEKGDFTIAIEGLTLDGRVVSQKGFFTVE